MQNWIKRGIGLCIAASAAQAMSFQPLGFESMGMGGAGVASATGSMAPYYNPALLAVDGHTTEVVLSGGVGVSEYNLAENLDRLSNDDLSGTLERIANNAPFGQNSDEDRNNIIDAKAVLKDMAGKTSGLVLTPGGAFGVQVKNFGIGLYVSSEATASPVIDPNRLDLVVYDDANTQQYYSYDPVTDTYTLSDQATYESTSLEYAINNGKTYLSLKGLSIGEVPFSYGHSFETSAGTVGVGGSLKYMYGITYDTKVSIDTSSGNVSDSFKDRDRRSSALGVDLGAYYTPGEYRNLRVAIVGKNLNGPEFDTVTNEVYKVDPMVRAGVYYAGFDHWLDFALDFDLTSNKTFLDGIDSQYIGGGINIHPTQWFSLRLGAMQNIADDTFGTVVTGGLGLGFKYLQIDLSGMVSTETGYYDGNEIPRYARLNLALVSRW
ncbi:putative exported protein [Hydrogenimonas sp.]|nr:putative exported protein [Hydrogenimonas sp.]